MNIAYLEAPSEIQPTKRDVQNKGMSKYIYVMCVCTKLDLWISFIFLHPSLSLSPAVFIIYAVLESKLPQSLIGWRYRNWVLWA